MYNKYNMQPLFYFTAHVRIAFIGPAVVMYYRVKADYEQNYHYAYIVATLKYKNNRWDWI